jgi:integrase/recombinase XerD
MTHLRKMMLEELERRNYAQTTIDCYIQTIADFARHFRRSPDQLTPEHIREYQAYLFRERKLAPSTVTQRLAALAQDRLQRNRASRNRGLKRKIIS